MAIKPDYEAGTVSITNGTTTLTGVNTFWALAGIQKGDTFKAKNLDAIVQAVVSNTEITLKEAWTGGDLAAASYALRYQPDGSRFAGAYVEIRELLDSGNVTAFAALVSAIDKIAYFTGAGTMALADFKAWARSFLGLTPAANKLAYYDSANSMALTDLTAAGRAAMNITGTPAADKLPYLTGVSGGALANLTAAGRALIGAADAAAQKTALSLVKADVGLGNVDNTSDANKPVSTLQAAALALKFDKTGGTLTGRPTVNFNPNVWCIDASVFPINIAASANYFLTVGSGTVMVTDEGTGATALFILGGGVVVLVAQTGAAFGTVSAGGPGYIRAGYDAGSTSYYFGNNATFGVTLRLCPVKTRPTS